MGVLCTELVVRWQCQALKRAGRLHYEKRTVPQWLAYPEWDEVSSELTYETNLTMHLDSRFLGVHLDSTFLGVHLDSTSVVICE